MSQAGYSRFSVSIQLLFDKHPPHPPPQENLTSRIVGTGIAICLPVVLFAIYLNAITGFVKHTVQKAETRVRRMRFKTHTKTKVIKLSPEPRFLTPHGDIVPSGEAGHLHSLEDQVDTQKSKRRGISFLQVRAGQKHDLGSHDINDAV
jgi:hypothetical protein